jgi:hypothetical protein
MYRCENTLEHVLFYREQAAVSVFRRLWMLVWNLGI